MTPTTPLGRHLMSLGRLHAWHTHRDRALVLLAVVWVAMGVSLLLNPDYYPDDRYYPMEYLPAWVRVGIWWASAGCALVAVWWPKTGSDQWGFVALIVPPAFRAAAFVAGAVFGSGLMLSAVVWIAITLFVYLIAGWPDPPPRGEDREGAPR